MSLLAAEDTAQYTGPVGLVIVVLIGVATVLLIMNMNKRIKKLPRSFEEKPAPRSDDPPAPPQP